MKKIVWALLAVLVFTACSNHGTKVTIEGSKGEVYYKGEGVSERDAKKLGNYLKQENYFDNTTRKSVQLVKAATGEGYDIHFVVDEKKAKEIEGVEATFTSIGIDISEKIFDGKPVNVFLSDEKIKDFITLPYDKKKAEEVATDNNGKTGELTYADVQKWDHDQAGGVTFYWDGMSDVESKRIADYIVQNGSFKGGASQLIMSKEGESYTIRFPVIETARNNADYMAQVEKVAKEIKENVFANAPFTFHVTNEKLESVKSWNY